MYSIFRFFLTLYDSILASIFFAKFNGYRVSEKKMGLTLLSIFLTCITLFINKRFKLFSILLCMAVSFIIMQYWGFCKISKLRCFFSCILYYETLMLNHILIYNLFYLVKKKHIPELLQEFTPEYMAMCILSKITLVMLITIYIYIADHYENKNYTSNIKWVVLIGLMSTFAICMCMNLLIDKPPLKLNIVIVFLMFFLCVNNLIAFYTYTRLSHKAKIETELELFRQKRKSDYDLLSDTKQYYDKLMRLQHDINNHLLHILYCIENHTYNNAIEYIKNICNSKIVFSEEIHISNNMLNYIINLKAAQSRESNIKFLGNIEDITDLPMEDFDLCSLLGNIFDNAIESSRNEKIQNRCIITEIYSLSGYKIFEIRNKICQSVLDNNRPLLSNKLDKTQHGYGMQQIFSIVQKYNGHIDIYEQHNFFIVKIMIP